MTDDFLAGTKGKEDDVEQPDSPSGGGGGESEFVSDAFQPSSRDLEEVKRGVSNLTKPSGKILRYGDCHWVLSMLWQEMTGLHSEVCLQSNR